jgi:hypothetical protein
MIFRCIQCDTDRDSDEEDGTVSGPDGLICSRCVEADLDDMAYAHNLEPAL